MLRLKPLAGLFCLLAVFFPSIVFAQVPETTRQMQFEIELEKRVQKLMKEHEYPGFAIGVVAGERPSLIYGFGVSDRQSGAEMSGDTIFQLGSVTKSITGYIFASLVAEGTMELDRDIWRYFPDTVTRREDEKGTTITLLNLATHTSGLPRYPDNLQRGESDPILAFSKEQLFTGLSQSELVSPVGESWEYSNFGYGALGYCMEQATEKSYSLLLSQYLKEPFGLSDTAVSMSAEQKTRLATPYIDEDPYSATVPWKMGEMTPAGGVYSTVNDMTLWIRTLLELEDRVLTMDQHRAFGLMRAPFQQAYSESTSYGLGFIIVHSPDSAKRVLWHGGDVDGYASVLMINPENKSGLILLTNCGKGDGLGELFTWIMEEAVALAREE